MNNATDISYIKSDTVNAVRCILQRMGHKESLSDFVRRIMSEQNLTYREVEARAKGKITGGYVNDIVQKKTTNPSIDKLKALAKGLGRPEDEVMSIARGSVKPSEDKEFTESLYFMLYEKAKDASPEKKEFIKSILKMIDRELDEDIRATN
jgi:transcriptional regulator with XRE-family HTH domain